MEFKIEVPVEEWIEESLSKEAVTGYIQRGVEAFIWRETRRIMEEDNDISRVAKEYLSSLGARDYVAVDNKSKDTAEGGFGSGN